MGTFSFLLGLLPSNLNKCHRILLCLDLAKFYSRYITDFDHIYILFPVWAAEYFVLQLEFPQVYEGSALH